jgi:hypothetical protein
MRSLAALISAVMLLLLGLCKLGLPTFTVSNVNLLGELSTVMTTDEIFMILGQTVVPPPPSFHTLEVRTKNGTLVYGSRLSVQQTELSCVCEKRTAV